MKNYILITTFFLSVISYSQSSHNNYQILDSLKYVKNLPDGNFYPKGDKIVEKIINIGDKVTCQLIERIKDTTTTGVRISDSYNYKVGNIAILILPYTSSKKIPLRNILFDEYSQELRNTDKKYSIFQQIYYKLFFFNTQEVNYKNRIRLYKKIKRWNTKKLKNKKIQFSKTGFSIFNSSLLYNQFHEKTETL